MDDTRDAVARNLGHAQARILAEVSSYDLHLAPFITTPSRDAGFAG